ncbi:NACHT domain-containing protein [Streptomyces sp. NPDC058246]|uniref:NACHT domain-containing protein n=1 Tax=Streptomyces sp. NPDC058246 TaxID=3346400 RepID=UPI0036EC4502
MEADDGATLDELKGLLRRLRSKQRLSMTALERRAGLGHTTVSQALNGPSIPSEATVIALGQALRAETGVLLELRERAAPPVHVRARQSSGEDDRFEDRYRQYVRQRHGRLSVVGLDLSRPERACWPLDAAYLSLELAVPSADMEAAGGVDPGPDGGSGARVRVERAEQALAGRRRTLVRGLAGSGKTTLLQWLAVGAARRDLTGGMSHLNGCIPFVLPLRSLVRRGELPTPDQYLSAAGCHLHTAQPPGWADGLLDSGRALLLIDGLDEVPQGQRAHTRRWLNELLAAYPRATCLITTRPSAVPEGWLADADFTEVSVRPMSSRDVGVFVTRWHTAAAGNVTTAQERDHLSALQEALKDTVRAQRDLAHLATTPLLCALVCALHRDRRGHLPHGRMELYEAALSMLLHRRDTERDIHAPEGLTLTEHHSIQLLQRLAYWLIRNGQTELDHDTAHALIADALPAMPHIAEQADADAVLTHLLARSGLIRQPTADTIDFVHRTFQDYLGAKAALESRDIPLLVKNAHDDQWEDVLRMAVAHARPDERARLLCRLISRGDRTPKHRSRLYLLAMACLEHATELDPAVRREVEARTAALLPPRGFDEARELSEVGPVILDLLPGPDGLEDDEAEAVVRTAGLIGGDAALTVVKRFRNSEKDNVDWALQAVWDRFDPHDYASEVLSHVPNLRMLTVSTPEQLAALRTLPSLPGVSFDGPFTHKEMASVLDPGMFQQLVLHDNPVLQQLTFLQAYTALERVSLMGCSNIEDLTDLANSTVKDLQLWTGSSVRLESLKELTGLTFFGIDQELPRCGLETLPVTADLTTLFLGSTTCRSIGTLRGITRWPNLTSLNLCGPVKEFSDLKALPHLDLLILQGDVGLSLLEHLTITPQITRLTVANLQRGDSLALVATALPQLKELNIHCFTGHRSIDLTPLRSMSDLIIRLYGAVEVTGAEHFPANAITRTPRPRN